MKKVVIDNTDAVSNLAEACGVSMRAAILAGFREEGAQKYVFAALRSLAHSAPRDFAHLAQVQYSVQIARLDSEGRSGAHQTSAARTIRATRSVLASSLDLGVFDVVLSKGKLAAAVKAAKAAQADAPEADAPEADAPEADAPEADAPEAPEAPEADAPEADAPEADLQAVLHELVLAHGLDAVVLAVGLEADLLAQTAKEATA